MSALSTVLGRGTLAARPAAGNTGRQYTVTDSGTTYRDNGSSWDITSPLGVASAPGTPTTNVPVFRADVGMWVFHDGTSWLSEQLYTLDLVGPFDGQATAAANGWPVAAANSPLNIGRKSIWHSDFALWLVNLYGESYTNATNNGSNYWTLSIRGAVTATAYGSINTSADTAATHTGHKAALNQAAGSTERAINTLLTKTGTPGSTFFPALITYRLIVP